MPASKTARLAPTAAHSTPPLVSHCIELLESAGPVRPRRMFGGWGFYVGDLFVALMIEDRLYLKVNAQTQARFQAAGGEPFVYDAGHKSVQVNYYTPPAEAMDAAVSMQPWVALAVQAALAARAGKTRPAPRKASARKNKGA